MKNRIREDIKDLHGYVVNDSSNVEYVGWENGGMFVQFRGGSRYRYLGVSRQRAVACARAKSVGKYINKIIKPQFDAVKVV